MQILATNMSSSALVNFGLNYLNLSGAPISESYTIPAKPPGSNTGTMVSGSQPASTFTSVSITIVGTTYTVLFGQILPTGLGVQVGWSQNNDASIVIMFDDTLGSI